MVSIAKFLFSTLALLCPRHSIAGNTGARHVTMAESPEESFEVHVMGRNLESICKAECSGSQLCTCTDMDSSSPECISSYASSCSSLEYMTCFPEYLLETVTVFLCPFYRCADSGELRENCSCELANTWCIYSFDPSFCSIADCCLSASNINKKKECINTNLNVLAATFDVSMEETASLYTSQGQGQGQGQSQNNSAPQLFFVYKYVNFVQFAVALLFLGMIE